MESGYYEQRATTFQNQEVIWPNGVFQTFLLQELHKHLLIYWLTWPLVTSETCQRGWADPAWAQSAQCPHPCLLITISWEPVQIHSREARTQSVLKAPQVILIGSQSWEPPCWIKNLKPREAKWLAQDHTVSLEENPGIWILGFTLNCYSTFYSFLSELPFGFTFNKTSYFLSYIFI